MHIVKSVKYKNNTINIVKDNKKNWPSWLGFIGVILISEDNPKEIKDLEKLSLIIGGPNLMVCPADAIERVEKNDKYLSAPLYYRGGKNIKIKTKKIRGYKKIGLSYMEKVFFDNIYSCRDLSIYKNFFEEIKKINTVECFEKYYWAKLLLIKDIENLSNYLAGNLYGYEIIDLNGKVNNSRHGFLLQDTKELIIEAKGIIDYQS